MFLISTGRDFHILGTSKRVIESFVRERGTNSVQFSTDLMCEVCVSDIGVNNWVMYSGVVLFNAL